MSLAVIGRNASRAASLVALLALVGCDEASNVDASTADVVDQTPAASGPARAAMVSHPLPTASGTFAARYVVPASRELEAAATFPIARAAWTVEDGVATLRYALPAGLVGGEIDVKLTGALAPDATSVELSGALGVGHCTATPSALTCHEEFGDLGDLPISMAAVDAVAALEFAGPVADREAVASVFASDPIGAIEIDLLAPVDPGDYDGDGG